MAPPMEARPLSALLRALLTVRFLTVGVFLINRGQRVARGGWRIANWVVASWKSLPQRPQHALLLRLPPASISPS